MNAKIACYPHICVLDIVGLYALLYIPVDGCNKMILVSSLDAYLDHQPIKGFYVSNKMFMLSFLKSRLNYLLESLISYNAT